MSDSTSQETQNHATTEDQIKLSQEILANSQQEDSFPHEINVKECCDGLKDFEIEVHEGVFSPRHFQGWCTFTRNFPEVKGRSVLEIGCGTGVSALYLAKYKGPSRVTAVDITPEAVANTRANARRHGLCDVQVYASDIFSAVPEGEKFDVIYWNMPFMYQKKDYSYNSGLERGLFDPDYAYAKRFLEEAPDYLSETGCILVGWGDFGETRVFMDIAKSEGYEVELLAEEKAREGKEVTFLLYELKRKPRVFYGQQFTGRGYEEIVKIRQHLREWAENHELFLIEQFDGVEEKEYYENHGYGPLFVVGKDHTLLGKADIVLMDFEGTSVGRDCELAVAKEVMDKRVIAIVPDAHQRNHPYVRLYSDYVVENAERAFELASKLLRYPLPQRLSEMTRWQKDHIDDCLAQLSKQDLSEEFTAIMPTELGRRWEDLFDEECETIVQWSIKRLPKYARINPLRAQEGGNVIVDFCNAHEWDCEKVFSTGELTTYRLTGGPKARRFGDSEAFRNGEFYVQDLASMLPALALDPQPGEHVLDLGAAPGSKTSQIAAMMKGRGRIVAVDNHSERLDSLRKIMRRTGAEYCVEPVLADATRLLPGYREQFDRVLVDAPCSSEGIIRYRLHKLLEWSLMSVYRLTRIQKGMLFSGYEALKPGGVLVYSTCTYAPEENEAIVQALLDRYPDASVEETLLPENVKTRNGKTQWLHETYHEDLGKAVRIYPQDNDTIGFFLAKIKKPDN